MSKKRAAPKPLLPRLARKRSDRNAGKLAREEAAAEALTSLAYNPAQGSAPVPCPKCGQYQPGMPVPSAGWFPFRMRAPAAFTMAALAALAGYEPTAVFATRVAVLLAVFALVGVANLFMPRRPASPRNGRREQGIRYALAGCQIRELERLLAPAKTDFFVDRAGRGHDELR